VESRPYLIRDQNILKATLQFARANRIKLYLVGGYLRDIILRRQKNNPDIDFCLKKGAINFGRKLARELKAGFVVLDRGHNACRLVKKTDDRVYTLDFMDFRGETLADDLLHRDFTINSLALSLEDIFGDRNIRGLLIDLYGGVKDLNSKAIRMVDKGAFDEDPLRILRAFSLSAIFSFKIDRLTLKLIKIKKNKLSAISHERIRDELFKILENRDAYAHLLDMDKLGVLKEIFPEIEPMRKVGQGPYHHLDVWQHSLETIKQLESLILEIKRNKDAVGYLNEGVSGDRKRYALIKLAAFLHDIGKPSTYCRQKGKITFHGHERVGLGMATDIGKRIKLSNEEVYSLGRIILWHLRPGYLADNPVVTARAKFRYFRDAGVDAAAILLLSIADQRSTKGRFNSEESRIHHEKVAFGLIKEYFRKNKDKKSPRLINGDDLIKEFKLRPSPLIGKVLSELEELQAIGRIKSKPEALEAAKRVIQSK